MKTAVYIKMDVHDQLLVSEGVCRQLGIFSCHPDVQTWRGGRKQDKQERGRKQPRGPASERKQDKQERGRKHPLEPAKVPTVRVRLVQAVRRLLLHSCAKVDVRCDANHWDASSLLFKRDPKIEEVTGLEMEDVLLHPTGGGRAQIIMSNSSGYTQVVERGLELGLATPTTVVQPVNKEFQESVLPVPLPDYLDGEKIRRVTLDPNHVKREQKLTELQVEE